MSTVYDVTVTSGEIFDIAAPLSAFFTQVDCGGTVDVLDGDYSNDVSVHSGGAQIVSSVRTAETGTCGSSRTPNGEAP
jgi:autotransporter passenger strand-loop-strand repeat protein